MAITKASIITEVNDNLQENFSGSQLDTAIQMCLDDMSEEDLLVDTDATQTLVAGDTVLNEPTGFRAMVAITLTIPSATATRTTYSFVDSDPDTILDSSNSFLTDGFVAGQKITVSGSASNNKSLEIETAVAGVITLITGNTLTAESAGATVTIMANGSEQFPLIGLKRGHSQYRELRHNDNSTGIPRWYSNFNGQFFLWRPPNQAFTSLIEYYKDHPQDVANIEFDETKFKNTIFAGVTYYVALKRKKRSYLEIWLPIYTDAKLKRSNAIYRNPRFVNGS